MTRAQGSSTVHYNIFTCDIILISKEQDGICLYTHRTINMADLFAGNVFDIEHTIPRSLSGDDSLALPMIAVGAAGVISVASNVVPREMGDMVRLALAGDFVGARALHEKYYRLFRDLFIDVNPVMVKEALAAMGKCERVFRLPLCETDDAKLAQLKGTMKDLGLVG